MVAPRRLATLESCSSVTRAFFKLQLRKLAFSRSALESSQPSNSALFKFTHFKSALSRLVKISFALLSVECLRFDLERLAPLRIQLSKSHRSIKAPLKRAFSRFAPGKLLPERKPLTNNPSASSLLIAVSASPLFTLPICIAKFFHSRFCCSRSRIELITRTVIPMLINSDEKLE